MTYIVFARKYRPQKFSDVLGQEHIVNVLKNGIKNNRIPHAMLFSGPRGVGKTTTARILAKALNCEAAEEGEPCLKCHSCNDIAEGSDIDVIEIDGASNRGIDEIRDLREKAKYATVRGKYKIFIIDEVHMLTKEAFNALLKILEEPPEHVIFIFATTEPYNVIPTILSRCQRFDFKRISLFKIIEQLSIICKMEQIEFEKEGLRLIAQLADGSMRDATSILDQLASGEAKVTYDNVNMMFGRLDTPFFLNFTDTIVKKDVKTLIDSLNEVMMRGYDLESFVSELSFHFHKLFLIKNDVITEDIQVMDEQMKERANAQAEEFSNGALTQITKELIETASKLKFTSNKKMLVENELARIVSFTSAKNIDEIIDMLKGFKPGTVSIETSKKKVEVEEAFPQTVSLPLIEQFSEALLEKDFFLSTAIKNSKILESKDNAYILEVPSTYMKDISQAKIDAAIEETGIDIKLNIRFKNDEKYNKIIKSKLEHNPRVSRLMENIDGEIIE